MLNKPGVTFRDGQWEAIVDLVERKVRLLIVQRTGWGKSLVYFLATHLLSASVFALQRSIQALGANEHLPSVVLEHLTRSTRYAITSPITRRV